MHPDLKKRLHLLQVQNLKGNIIKTTTTRYALTLHPAIGGNARTKEVSLEGFNRY